MEKSSIPPPPASLPKYLRQDFLTPRCKELLSTLPSEKGWLTSSSHLYRGFWIETAFLNATLSCQSHFHARNEDILLVSYPKSGTTWLKAAVFALTHRSRQESSDSVEPDHPLLIKSPHDLIPFLEIDLYFQSECPDLSSFPNPRIFATHIPYSLLPGSMKDSGCKIIYMCRNPKDTLISYWQFTNRLQPSGERRNTLEEVLDQFCSGRCPFGPFWDHIHEYWKDSLEMPERVLFLKYEEMMERPGETIGRMADFIGCQVPEEASKDIAAMCSFENLSSLEANKNGNVPSGAESRLFFRRGKVGDWANFLSPEMSKKIDLTMDEKLRGTGLKF